MQSLEVLFAISLLALTLLLVQWLRRPRANEVAYTCKPFVPTLSDIQPATTPKPRPYRRLSVAHLEALMQAGPDLTTLQRMSHELSFRDEPQADALAVKVRIAQRLVRQ